MSDSGYSENLERATALARAGNALEGENLLLAAIRETETQQGTGSAAYADAQAELGAFLMMTGQTARGAAALRAAVAGPEPQEESARRDRLTYLLNLGQALDMLGEVEEAEEVLRQGLTAREAFYGRDRAGYAFGLEPLAAVLLRQGKAQEALPLIEETVRNFWNNRHPRITGALGWRALALRAAGDATPPFAGLDGLPEEMVEEVVGETLNNLGEVDIPPAASRAVLNDLYYLVTSRLGEEHPALLNVLATIANGEAALGPQGNHRARQASIRQSVALYEKQGQAAQAVLALQGLALALDDAGEPEAASQTYEEAASRAELLGDGALQSHVRRNYGLHLAEINQREAAEHQLRAAVSAADTTDDDEMLGRAQGALGIFLQHNDRLDEAKALLDEALRYLEPFDPDALTARNHRDAIVNGAPDPCGDPGASLNDAIQSFVVAHLPEGLLERIDVTSDDVQVYLAREPSEEEVQLVGRVVSLAQAELRRRIAARRP